MLAEASKTEADIAWEQVDVGAWNPPWRDALAALL